MVLIIARETSTISRVARLTLNVTRHIAVLNSTKGTSTTTLMRLAIITGAIVSKTTITITVELGGND